MFSRSLFLVSAPICLVATSTTVTAFSTPHQNSRGRYWKTTSTLATRNALPIHNRASSFQLFFSSNNINNDNDDDKLGQEFDALLEQGKLGAARALLQRSHDSSSIVTLENRQRWSNIFHAIEVQTAQAEETVEQVNTRRMAEFPLTSQARNDMTQMYQTLADQSLLRVFGAISSQQPPAAGSHSVRPSLLEHVTQLPMKALTPKQSNALLYAGAAVAVLEGILSVALQINLNLLVLSTITAFALDRFLLNGAISESIYKLFSPGMQTKIERHEAGHFLCAYLLGCPVEGCVLDAWAALQDSRFGMGRQVTAGTSFFDPLLSQQINSPARQVTRSSIDRYSIIVMAGIAAEALYYGQADGGAGDEMALIAFLSQLNGGNNNKAWNNVTIRNQARWGALQAVLILKEYKACYEALVEALEQGGRLGDCIYAIEKAARDNNLGPLQDPLGYIVKVPGMDEEKWTTEPPPEFVAGASNGTPAPTTNAKTAMADPKESMAKLSEYRKEMEDKLKAIDQQLEGISGKDSSSSSL